MKVAIVHYWWLSNRGGESVVSAILDLYPEADLYVQVCDEKLVRRALGPKFRGKIIRSFVSRLPAAKKKYKIYMPLMPLAAEQWDLTEYDLVISSESGPAKGVLTRPDALHICYCHSPMRYIWDMYQPYLKESGWLIRHLFPLISHWLRVWDRSSADRVDKFIANSRFVARRIWKFYRKEAGVIWPPVDVAAFDHLRPREDFYLCLGQLVHYKRSDLAVEAFNTLGLPLVVIGEGELMDELKKKAAPNITLLGRQPFHVVKDHLERCRGLIFPGVEDFGIVPVEAMAAGAPVIAYGYGGILDTVVDQQTGLLFSHQDASSLAAAVIKIESREVVFDPVILRAHATKFDRERFKHEIMAFVQAAREGL